MRSLAIIFAIVGVCSAATFVAMDDKDLEKVMMGGMYAQDPSHPFMGVGTIMATQRQEKEQDPAAEAGEVIGLREARDADEAQEEPHANVHAPRQNYAPYNMFTNGFMGMMIPEMMFPSQQNNGYHHEPAGNGHATNNGNGYGATPYASQPAVNGHAVANGNGQKRPANGNSRPSNGHSRPNGNGNGNGKRGGSASAASAGSFNKGSGSFSQAQAFSGSF